MNTTKHEERITLQDTNQKILLKMSDGNPGAAVILSVLFTSKIDKDAAIGDVHHILLMDSFGIYGDDIYVLFSDICDKDYPKMLAVLRAVQLGFFDRETLYAACHRQDYKGKDMVPVAELYLKVKERLPNFNS